MPDGERSVFVEVKSRIYSRDLEKIRDHLDDHSSDVIGLVVAPRIGSRLGERMRHLGVNHVDLQGRVYIRSPGLIVSVLPPRSSEKRLEKPNRNPFTDKASLVLRSLLLDRSRIYSGTRLSELGGVSKGWVSQVSHELLDRGYVERDNGGIRLVDPVSALADWTTFYGWQRNYIESYVTAFDKNEIFGRLRDLLDGFQTETALTLLSATDYMARHVEHEQLHLYMSRHVSERLRHRLEKELYLRRVKEGGAVHLIHPFYRDSLFFDARERDGVPIVSPVQLYLDLAHYPLRGRESARMLVRTVLSDELQLTSEEASRLTVMTE